MSANGAYGSRTWTYDTNGNRRTESSTVAGTTTNSGYTYPMLSGHLTSNLLTNIMQGTSVVRAFTYNPAGATTADTKGGVTTTYGIDNTGRISTVQSGSTTVSPYVYDAYDRLSLRSTNLSFNGNTEYIYDAWGHLLAEEAGSGGYSNEYIWLNDLPVAVLTNGSTLSYMQADHLKRPELMTDTSGTIAWQATYEPFGAVSTITTPVVMNLRFPGQWFQPETGLHQNWHRHYDPTLGRYTSPDPLGVSRAGPSLLTYVRNSPLMGTDRRGLDNPNLGKYGCWAPVGACAPPPIMLSFCPPGFILSPFWPVGDTDGSAGAALPGGIFGGAGFGGASFGGPPGSPFGPGGEPGLGDGGEGFMLSALLGIVTAGAAAEAEVFSGLGDLTLEEATQIQDIVDQAGRPLEVVGSAARGTRGVGSDIDYVVPPGSLRHYEGLDNQLPGIDPSHGIIPGYGNNNIGPVIRFEPRR